MPLGPPSSAKASEGILLRASAQQNWRLNALQKSLQRGVDAHAQFLEVWEPDVLSPAAQNVLAAIANALAK